MKKLILIAGLALAAASLVACDVKTAQQTTTDVQREAAVQRVAKQTTQCNECDMIEFKRTVMGKPGLIGYVAFLSQNGTPIAYYTVKGKCTSGSKRLTQSRRVELLRYAPGIRYYQDGDTSNDGRTEAVDGPSEDGTYGSSGDYIFCRTTNDAYVQWNGPYLFQDQPFDLTTKALVISIASDPNKLQGQ